MAEFDRKIYEMFDVARQDQSKVVLTSRYKTECEKWIAKRKETWRFHQELLNTLINQGGNTGYSKDVKCWPTHRKDVQALFRELKRSVEAKQRRDEENGLFISRELLTSSVENFREAPKLEDSQETLVCSDLQHISGGAGSKPSALTDDARIQNKHEDSLKVPTCPDIQQDVDVTGSDLSAPTDDTRTQHKAKRSKRPSLKHRVLKFFWLK